MNVGVKTVIKAKQYYYYNRKLSKIFAGDMWWAPQQLPTINESLRSRPARHGRLASQLAISQPLYNFIILDL